MNQLAPAGKSYNASIHMEVNSRPDSLDLLCIAANANAVTSLDLALQRSGDDGREMVLPTAVKALKSNDRCEHLMVRIEAPDLIPGFLKELAGNQALRTLTISVSILEALALKDLPGILSSLSNLERFEIVQEVPLAFSNINRLRFSEEVLESCPAVDILAFGVALEEAAKAHPKLKEFRISPAYFPKL